MPSRENIVLTIQVIAALASVSSAILTAKIVHRLYMKDTSSKRNKVWW
jgi:hypothetical protein